MNTQLNRNFYGTCAKYKIEKVLACLAASDGRTERSSELTDTEAMWFIREGYLKMRDEKVSSGDDELQREKLDKIRKSLIAVAYSMGRNIEWLKGWLKKQTGKSFNELSGKELIAHRNVLNKIRSQEINKV